MYVPKKKLVWCFSQSSKVRDVCVSAELRAGFARSPKSGIVRTSVFIVFYVAAGSVAVIRPHWQQRFGGGWWWLVVVVVVLLPVALLLRCGGWTVYRGRRTGGWMTVINSATQASERGATAGASENNSLYKSAHVADTLLYSRENSNNCFQLREPACCKNKIITTRVRTLVA